MLVITRKTYETMVIGDEIRITIIEVKGDKVKLGIDAPKDIPVDREEVWLHKKQYGEKQ